MLKILFKILGFGDKIPLKSLTFWGLLAYTVGEAGVVAACGTPELRFDGTTGLDGFCAVADSVLQKAGVILTALGIRKAKKQS